MWRVTTTAIDWELIPENELTSIRNKITWLSNNGFTNAQYIQDPVSLDDGTHQRQRDFATLESAQEYADFINALPSDLVNVVSIDQVE
jgi:hypothetical protein